LAFLAFPGSALASSSPSIDSVSVSDITERDATLEAEVNPEGLETTYEFWLEYNVCQGPGIQCESIATNPVARGHIVAGDEGQAVSIDLNDLHPGYSYAYWVVATNAAGTIQGSRREFKTLPEGTAPRIVSESVSGITERDATLEAEVNPEGLETTYEFWLEYNVCQGPGIQCESIATNPVAQGHIAAGDEAQIVRTDLSDLTPGYSYSYWVVATNSAGKTASRPQNFTTLSIPAGSSPEHPYNAEPSLEALTLGNTFATAAPQGEVTRTQPVAPLITTSPADTTTTTTLTAASLTPRAQNLAKALKMCDKTPKKLRVSCQRRAQKTYGTSGKQASRKRHKS